MRKQPQTRAELIAEMDQLRRRIGKLLEREQQLLESESRLIGILRKAPSAVLITDSGGRIVLANEQAERLFGFEHEGLLLSPVEILIPVRLREAHVAHRIAYAENPTSRPMEQNLILIGQKKDGTEFPVDVGLSPIRTRDGFLITCVIRDLTGYRDALGASRQPGVPGPGERAGQDPRAGQLRKSTLEEIRERFDSDVDRFSNLETGQSATMDAPLIMQLICEAAARCNPDATHVLDIGCGAGNFSLKLLHYLPGLHFDLVDLSRPMLDRATERLRPLTGGEIRTFQGDILGLALEPERYDIAIAGAVLHHLRGDGDWERVFLGVYKALQPSGSFWISDLVDHSIPAVHELLRERYGSYLSNLVDESYRDRVFSYIEVEDTPRPVLYQTDLLYRAGFRSVEILHKNAAYAAFGAVK